MKKSGEAALIKNTGILMLGKMATYLVNFLLLPVYTSLFSKEDYGLLDLYSSMIIMVLAVGTLQIEQAMFRKLLLSKGRNEHQRIISSSFIILVAMSVLYSLLFLLCTILTRLSYSSSLYFYYLFMLFSTYLLQICRGLSNDFLYAVSSFLLSLFSVILNILFIVYFKLGVQGALLATGIAHFIICIFIIIKLHLHDYLSIHMMSITFMKEMLCYSIPLIFSQIASWVINNSDRLIILTFLGLDVNGIYSVANKFSQLISVAFSVFILAWTENVVCRIKDSDCEQYFSKMIGIISKYYLLGIGMLLIGIGIVFEDFINPAYSSAYFHVPLLLLGMYFTGIASMYGAIYIGIKKTKEFALTTILSGGVNIVIHLLLIRQMNLFAASISTLFSMIILFFFRIIRLKPYLNIHIAIRPFFIPFINLAICCLAYYVASQNILFIMALLEVFVITAYLWKDNEYLLRITRELFKK